MLISLNIHLTTNRLFRLVSIDWDLGVGVPTFWRTVRLSGLSGIRSFKSGPGFMMVKMQQDAGCQVTIVDIHWTWIWIIDDETVGRMQPPFHCSHVGWGRAAWVCPGRWPESSRLLRWFARNNIWYGSHGSIMYDAGPSSSSSSRSYLKRSSTLGSIPSVDCSRNPRRSIINRPPRPIRRR